MFRNDPGSLLNRTRFPSSNCCTRTRACPDQEPIPSAATVRHFFKREALYELVWTAPVSEVARKTRCVGRRPRKAVPSCGYTDSWTWLLGQSRIWATHRHRTSASCTEGSAGTTQDSQLQGNIEGRGSSQCGVFSAAPNRTPVYMMTTTRSASVGWKARTIPRLRAETAA